MGNASECMIWPAACVHVSVQYSSRREECIAAVDALYAERLAIQFGKHISIQVDASCTALAYN